MASSCEGTKLSERPGNPQIIVRTTILVLLAALGVVAWAQLLSAESAVRMALGRYLALAIVVDVLMLLWLYRRKLTACTMASLYMNLSAAPVAVFIAVLSRIYVSRLFSHQPSEIGTPTTASAHSGGEGMLLLLVCAAIKTLFQSIVIRFELLGDVTRRTTASFLIVEALVMAGTLYQFWWPHTASVIE